METFRQPKRFRKEPTNGPHPRETAMDKEPTQAEKKQNNAT